MTAVPRLTVRVQHGASAQTVIEVGGELDFAAVEELRGRLLPATEHGTVVLDMGGITFCDSSGVRTLVEADRSAHEHGAVFRIAAPSEDVLRVLSLTGTDLTLEVFPDVDSALAH
jgi:anti-sigma B factor antagonist